jgi:hypothetical protein
MDKGGDDNGSFTAGSKKGSKKTEKQKEIAP